ncbi:MAG: aminoacyl-tRNA hydrolase [Bacillales bacterium]|nr:aminoacyl-tRNA hydrolase [Bacillales bacterium]
MKLVVGLGNPDRKYKNTRHNVGFMVLDAFANKNGYVLKEEAKFQGLVYKDQEFVLLKPLTYMNLSGDSVYKTASFYKISPEDILIISDDFNLPFLKLRLREKGSAGGHNGLKSIIASLSSESFNRLRIGLGEPEEGAIDFVLSKLGKKEKAAFEEIYPQTNEIISEFIQGIPFDTIMNKFN